MAPGQVVKTLVTSNNTSQDSNHEDDHFQSTYITPGFKPFSYSQQSNAILAKKFAYVISLLHNILDAGWQSSEAVEMHVWKLLVALKELKVDK